MSVSREGKGCDSADVLSGGLGTSIGTGSTWWLCAGRGEERRKGASVKGMVFFWGR